MQNVVFLVFLLPVVLSILFGTLVLADVLNQPNRELNLFNATRSSIYSDDIKIQNLLTTYSVSQPIDIEIQVSEPDFDCGDLYITIYSLESSPKQVFNQNGFFSQCFVRDNLTLPTEDVFSEKIDTKGKYEIVVELIDKHHKKTITTSSEFTVK